MLSTALHGPRAIAVNIEFMRANTDEKFTVVFDAIGQLMTPPEPKKKRPIGFIASLEK